MDPYLPNNQISDENLMPISEAADFLGISIDTLRRWDKSGKINSIRPNGKDRYFSLKELEKVKYNKPLSITEVSEELKLSPSTLRRLEKKGLLVPKRDENGIRLYDYDIIKEFVNSDYFLRKSKVNQKILNSVKVPEPATDYTSKSIVTRDLQKAKGSLSANIKVSDAVEHKLKGENAIPQEMVPEYLTVVDHVLVQQQGKLENIRKFKKIVLSSLGIFASTFLFSVVVITVMFLVSPYSTADFFGYMHQGKILGALSPVDNGYSRLTYSNSFLNSEVLGISTQNGGDSLSSLNIVSSVLKPSSKTSLKILKVLNETSYLRVVPTAQIKDVNEIFFIDGENNLVSTHNIKLPSGSGISLNNDLLQNVDAISVQGHTPGNNPGNLVVYDAEGNLPGVTGEIFSLKDGSVSGGLGGIIFDNSIDNNDLALNSVSSKNIINGTINNEDLADNSVNSSTIEDESIDSEDIKDNAIDTSNLSSTLVFDLGDFIDLSAIDHSTSTPQGLLLPNVSSATSISPSSGEGYISYDISGNQVLVYDGSSWVPVGAGDITSITTGNGLTGGATSGDITLNLDATTNGTTATTSSNSGLEINSDGISLLRGCSDNEILKWDAGTSVWQCEADSGGGGSSIDIEEGDSLVVSSTSSVDFLAVDFAVTNSPSGEANVSIDYSNSKITRSDQAETITNTWVFNGAVDSNGNLSIADTDISLDGASTNFTITGDFSINTNDIFVRKSDGSVGIGTTGPTDTLHVVGNVLATAGVHVGTDADGTLIDDASNGASSTTLYIGNESILASGDIGVSVQGYNANTTTLGSSIDLASEVSGTLPIANGGTNNTSYVTGGLTYYNGTSLTDDVTGLFWNAGSNYLGIGTSNPAVALDVVGSANISGTLDLGTNTISDGNFAGNWAYNSGNLSGIGTLSAGSTVTFSGLGTGTDNTVVILNGSNQLTTDEIDSRVWGTSLLDGNGTTNYLTKYSDADTLTNSVVYETGGSLGIGTTNPTDTLHVVGNVLATAGVHVGTDADGTLIDDASNGASSTTLYIGNESILASGDIGVSVQGYNANTTILGSTIEGSEITNGTIQEVDLDITNSPTDNYILTYDSGSTGFTWVDPGSLGGGTVGGTGASGYVSVWNDTTNITAGTIYDTGSSVGIGTTGPTDTLHVVGNVLATAGVHVGTDADGTLIDDASNGASSTTLYIGNESILASGDIGVSVQGYNANTTTLGSSIDLASEVSGTLPIANGGTNNTSYVTGGLTYYNGTSLTDDVTGLFWNAGSNYLGIGTSNPAVALDVVGSANISGTLDLGTNTISDGNFAGNWAYNSGNLSGIGTLSAGSTVTFSGLGTGTDNTVVILNGSNQLTTDEIDSRVWGTSLLDGNGTTNYLTKYSDADTLTNSVVYETGGSLGIGTTNPTDTLHVVGNVLATAGVHVGTDADGTLIDDASNGASSTTLYIGNESILASGDIGVSVQGYNANTTTLGSSIDLASEVSGTLPIANGGTNNTSYVTGGLTYYNGTSLTDDVTGLFWNAGSNYLGIGTSNPAVALDVVGSANISGTLDLGTNTISDGNFAGNWAYNSGNLSGIGTLSAGSTVTFSGLGTGTDNTVVILNGSNQLTTDEIDSRVWGTSLLDGNGTTNYLTKYSDADTLTNSVVYETGGSLGIGTTNPTDTLHVVGNVLATAGVHVGTDADGTLIDDASNGASSTTLYIGNESILASGDIGVSVQGYNANTTILGSTIEGSEITNGTIQEVDLDITNSPTDNYILTYDSGSTGFTWVDPGSLGGGTVGGTGASGYVSVWNDTTNITAGTIYDTGSSVGIGTTGPTDTLHVVGNVLATAGVHVGTDADGTLIDDASNGASSTTLYIGNESILASGDIGVSVQGYNANTTTLGSSIDLASEVSGTLPIANGGTNNTSYVTGGLTYYNGTSLTDDVTGLFWNAGSNYLGIGTSNPAVALDVVGSANISGTLDLGTNTISDGNFAGNWAYNSGNLSGIGTLSAGSTVTFSGLGTGTDNTVVILNGSNQLTTDEIDSRVWGTSLLDGNGTTNYLTKYSDADTLTNSVVYETGGSLGIGTTNPTDTLHVVGNVLATAGVHVGTDADGTLIDDASNGASSTTLYIGNESILASGDIGVSVQGYNANTTTLGSSIDLASEVSGTLPIANGGTNNTSYVTGGLTYYNGTSLTDDVTGLFWNAGSNYLGIGTSNPAVALDVVGSANISGTLDLGTNTISDGNFAGNWAYNSGNLSGIGTLSAGSTVTFSGLGTGTDNTVVILNGSNQLTTDEIDSRVWGTSLLDGNGTTNYLTKYSDADTLTNSVVYETGGSLGIGTTNPTDTLHVVGNVLATAGVHVGTDADGTLIDDASNGASSTTLYIGNESILASGDIGVSVQGYNANTTILGSTIEGSEITNGTIQEVDLDITNSPTDNYILTYDSGSTGFTWVDPGSLGGGTVGGTGASGYVSVWNDTTNITTGTIYDTGSSVGIGTTGPTDTLHVVGNVLATAGVHVGTDADGTLIDDASNGASSTTLYIGNESILASGDIGVSVQGYNANTTTLGSSIDLASEVSGTLPIANGGTNNTSYVTGGLTYYNGTSLTDDVTGLFWNAGSNYLGIGTSNPAVALDVVGSANISGTLDLGTNTISDGNFAGNWAYNSGNLSGIGTLSAGSTVTFSGLGTGTDNTVVILNGSNQLTTDEIDSRVWGTSLLDGNGTTNYLTKYSDADTLTNSVVYETGGSLGIGTTNPTDTLHVVGNVLATAGVHVGTDADGTLIDDASNGASSTTLYIGNESILASGDIGVSVQGYNANTTILGSTIEGSEITNGTIQEVDLDITNSPTDNYILTYDSGSTGFTWVDPGSLGGGTVGGTGASGYVSVWNDTTNITTGTIYDTGSSVGIGTTGPTDTLHVVGNVLATAGVHVGTDADGTLIDDASNGASSTTLYIGNESILASGDIGVSVQGYNANTTTLGSSIDLASEVSGTLPIANGGTNNTSYVTGGLTYYNGTSLTDDVTGLFWNAGSNYLGIGTSNPAVALDVVGSANISGTLDLGTNTISDGNFAGNWAYNSGNLSGIGTLSAGSTVTFSGLGTGTDNTVVILNGSNQLTTDEIDSRVWGTSLLDGNGTTNYLTKYSDADTLTNSVVYETGGSLGIGTTNPTDTLHVVGNVLATAGVHVGTDADGTLIDDASNGASSTTLYIGNESILASGDIGVSVQGYNANTTTLGSSIDLASEVSGTLPIANGGTNNTSYVTGGLTYYNGTSLTDDVTGLFWNAGSNYLGIGTSNPAVALDVVGSANISGTLDLGTNTISDGNFAGNWAYNSGNLSGIGTLSAGSTVTFSGLGTGTDNTVVILNGSNQLTTDEIDSRVWGTSLLDGNGTTNYLTKYSDADTLTNSVVYETGGSLGIGTTNPTDTLHVVGNVLATAGVHVGTDADGTLIDDASNGASSTTLYIGNESILASGDIGVSVQGYNANTTTLGSSIDLASEVSGTLPIANGGTNNTSYVTGGLTYYNGTSLTDDVTGLFWNAGSNYLGIGTSNPAVALDVVGSANISGTLDLGTNTISDGNFAGNWAYNSGNLSGIGTLSAGSTVTFSGLGTGTDNTVVILNGSNQLTTDEIDSRVWGTSLLDGNGTTNYLTKYSDADTLTNSVVYETGGSLGIGTTNPTDTLHVVGNVLATAGVHVGTDADGTLIDDASNGASSTTLYIGNESILASGDIGVSVQGYNANTTILGSTIEGSEITNGTIQEVDLDITNSPTDNYILTYDSGSTGFTWVDPGSLGGGTVGGTGASGYVSVWNDTTNITTGTIYDTGSSVGIGTTGPTDTLHVVGNVLATAGVHVGTDADGTLIDDASNGASSTTLYIGNESILASGDIGVSVQGYNANTTTLGSSIDLASEVSGTLPIANGGTNNTSYVTGGLTYYNGTSLTDDVTGLFWNAGSNYLGIGTSNPAVALDVVGSANISGTLDLGTNTISDGNFAGNWAYNSGNLSGIGTLSAGSTVTFSGLGTGTDNTVVILNGSNQLTTDEIDSRVWGTSLLDGNGTTNYLTKYSDADTLTNSVVYETGGSLGIGTTNPTDTLHVVGNVLATAGVHVGTDADGTLIDDASNGASSTTLYIGNESILASGDIGVSVQGYNANTTTLGSSIDLASEVSGTLPIANGGTNNTSYVTGGLTYYNGTSLTDDVTGLFWNAGSNYLGIGTSNPAVALDVVGSANISGTLDLGTNTISDGNFAGNWAYNSGNLSGIGTLSAGSTVTFSGLGTGTDNTVVILNGSNQLTTDEIDSRVWGTSLLDGNGTTNYLTKYSDADTLTNSVVYETGGSLGIGTTNPTDTLHVVGNVLATAGVHVGTDADGTLIDDASNGASSTTLYIGNESILASGDIGVSVQGYNANTTTLGSSIDLASEVSGTLPIANGGTNNTSYVTGGLTYYNGTSLTDDVTGLFWNAGSNYLGIGTSNPAVALDVVGSANISGTLDLGTNTISDGNFAGNWAYNSGNLSGIGTLSAGSTVTFSGLGTGTDNTVVILNGSNQLTTDEIDSRVWGTSLLDGNGTTNYLTKYSDADTLTNSVVYETGGSLGIGTTNPTDTLHVVGNVLATAGVHVGTDADGSLIDDASNGASSTTLYIGNESILASGDIGVSVQGYNANTTTLGSSIDLASEVSGTLPIANGGTNNTSYVTGGLTYYNGTSLTDDVTGLFWNAGSNYLGIGTSNPAVALDVVGSASLTGTLAVNGDTITSDGATLTINAGGNVDIQDALNVDSLTSDAGVSIASGSSYTGVGTVTLTSASGNSLTVDSGTTGALNIGTGNNAKTISIGTGSAGNTLYIATNETGADSIAIGNSNASTTLNIYGGDDWSIISGVLTVQSCSGCGGGSQTPWTSDINAGGYDLGSLSNLGFQETTGAPTGSDVGVFRDNSGDLNLNVLTSKSFNIQVNGTDEYNFGSTSLAMNSNNITGLGTTLSSAAGLTISTTTTGALTLDSGTTGNVNLGTGNNAKTIAIGTGNAGNIINIGTDNSVSDDINIGSALDQLSLVGDDWSITDAGAATFAAALAANGGITFDNSSDTISAFTAAGNIDLNTSYILSNIGNAGTDFTGSGGLTLAGALTVSSGGATITSGSLAVNSDSITSDGTLLINANNVVQLGDGSTNYFSFDEANGPEYFGTARPTKKLTLSPEYSGAVLTAFNGNATDSNTTGTMTSDAETSTTDTFRTYYNWVRTSSTLHYYTVAVRVTLPEDFSDWSTSNAIQVDYEASSTSASSNVLDVRIYLEDNATAVTADTGNAPSSTDTWETITIDDVGTGTSDGGLDDNTGTDWDTAGQTAVIYLRMGSASSNHMRIGDIVLNYEAKF